MIPVTIIVFSALGCSAAPHSSRGDTSDTLLPAPPASTPVISSSEMPAPMATDSQERPAPDTSAAESDTSAAEIAALRHIIAPWRQRPGMLRRPRRVFVNPEFIPRADSSAFGPAVTLPHRRSHVSRSAGRAQAIAAALGVQFGRYRELVVWDSTDKRRALPADMVLVSLTEVRITGQEATLIGGVTYSGALSAQATNKRNPYVQTEIYRLLIGRKNGQWVVTGGSPLGSCFSEGSTYRC